MIANTVPRSLPTETDDEEIPEWIAVDQRETHHTRILILNPRDSHRNTILTGKRPRNTTLTVNTKSRKITGMRISTPRERHRTITGISNLQEDHRTTNKGNMDIPSNLGINLVGE
jgi:hypothetical protein